MIRREFQYLRPWIRGALIWFVLSLTIVLEYLEWLQPTGYGNPRPLFASRGLNVVNSRTVGKDNTHLKMTVSDGWITFDAIAFRQGHWHEQMPKRIDLIYTFEINEFRGQETLQLNVRDIRTPT